MNQEPPHYFGRKKQTANLYISADKFVKTLTEPEYETDKHTHEKTLISGDYDIDEKTRQVMLSEEGVRKAEKFFKIDNLYDIEHTQLVHHINQALRANYIMMKGVEYVVNDEQEIVIVDQFTGRMMPGRAYSDGLHQAIEAKEGVPIKEETSTLATITYQNFLDYIKISRNDRYGQNGRRGILIYLQHESYRDSYQQACCSR